MPPECPTCFLTAHDGPCTRDPDEVKAEQLRRLRAENERLRGCDAEANKFADMLGVALHERDRLANAIKEHRIEARFMQGDVPWDERLWDVLGDDL